MANPRRNLLLMTLSISMFWIPALIFPTLAQAIPQQPSRQQSAKVNHVLENARTKSALSKQLGTSFDRCHASSASVEICEWRLSHRESGWKPLADAIGTSKRIAVLCALPRDGKDRLKSACAARPRDSNRREFSTSRYRNARNLKMSDVRQAFRQLAQGWIDDSLTMASLSFLLGSVPDRCETGGAHTQSCVWYLDESDYGQGTVATSIGARVSKKVVFDCALPIDGSPRAVESCVASVQTRGDPTGLEGDDVEVDSE